MNIVTLFQKTKTKPKKENHQLSFIYWNKKRQVMKRKSKPSLIKKLRQLDNQSESMKNENLYYKTLQALSKSNLFFFNMQNCSCSKLSTCVYKAKKKSITATSIQLISRTDLTFQQKYQVTMNFMVCHNYNVEDQSQKQPAEVFCKKKCSSKFRKILRKTPVLESLF